MAKKDSLGVDVVEVTNAAVVCQGVDALSQNFACRTSPHAPAMTIGERRRFPLWKVSPFLTSNPYSSSRDNKFLANECTN